jgi:hypothetical protein
MENMNAEVGLKDIGKKGHKWMIDQDYWGGRKMIKSETDKF